MRRLAKWSPVVVAALLSGCQHTGAPKPVEGAANPAATELAGPPAVPTRPSESIPVLAAAAAPEAKPRIGAPLPIPPPVISTQFVVPKGPEHLPAVEESKDNPTTPEKVLLGYALFFDKRLSKDDSMACEGCHHIDKAYTSGHPVDPKVGGANNKRNAPPMVNVAYGQSFYWDGRKPTLEAVSQAAWTGQLGADPKAVAAKLAQNATYVAHFQAAFKEGPTADNVPKALASFLRTLKSGNSPFDQFEKGDEKAVNKDVKAGYEVFVVADAVGGTSVTAHEMALRRIEQAGGKMISVAQLYCELQRDWSRKETIPGFMHLFTLLKHQPPLIT